MSPGERSGTGGQITAQTLIILGSMAPYSVPITGGSGAYEGAVSEVGVHLGCVYKPIWVW
jgi:hypothetical protein